MYRKPDASHLKIVAMISMVIDHLTAFLVPMMLPDDAGSLFQFPVYAIGRHIGRIAFPIFCFLICEGAIHTRDRKKYAIRLLILAFLSQIPFSIANGAKWWSLEEMNVMFSLLGGLGMISLWDRGSKSKKWLTSIAGMVAICVLCVILNTDYMFCAPITILTLYIFRNSRIKQAVSGALAFAVGFAMLVVFTLAGRGIKPELNLVLYNYFSIEICNLLGFALIAFYSGMKGKDTLFSKKLYLIYPVHLLLIGIIRAALIN